jgi:hypothetical protein
MKFACFGGAAAVADEAVVFAHQQTQSRRPRRRMKLFSSKDGNTPSKAAASPGTKSKRITSPGRRDLDIYDMIAAADVAAGKPSWSSSVPSSSALSTAASLDSAYSLSSSSRSSSSRSSSSSASSLLEAMAPPTQPAKRRLLHPEDEQKRSPAVGAAAVLVCLVMMMVGGRLAATLLTAAVLCFFPRQCHPAHRPAASKTSPEPAAALRREAIDAKAVMDGFLSRNRNK